MPPAAGCHNSGRGGNFRGAQRLPGTLSASGLSRQMPALSDASNPLRTLAADYFSLAQIKLRRVDPARWPEGDLVRQAVHRARLQERHQLLQHFGMLAVHRTGDRPVTGAGSEWLLGPPRIGFAIHSRFEKTSSLSRERRFQQIDVILEERVRHQRGCRCPSPQPSPRIHLGSIRESLSGRGGKRMPHLVTKSGTYFGHIPMPAVRR